MLSHRRLRATDDRGVTLVLCALLLTALLGMAAFVVDLGHARQSARNEQAAGDAGALAGAQDLPAGAAAEPTRSDVARSSARTYVEGSLGGAAVDPACVAGIATCSFTVGDHAVTVTTPYALAGSSIPAHNLVRVEICREIPQFFAGLFTDGEQTVCRSAVARNVQVSSGVGLGIVALNPNFDCTVSVNGNNTVTVTGGAVIANSMSTAAVCGSSPSGCGSFVINATLVAAVGGIPECVEDHTNGEVVEHSDAVADPFASLPDSPCAAPAATPCSGSPARPTAAGVCSSGGMAPGRFASGCDLKGGNGTTQMVPGVYWFQGTFDPQNWDLRCSTCSAANGGVLMYFENGSLSHSGNGTVQLLPYQLGQPEGSVYAGLSIYQARSNNAVMTVGGTAGSGMGSIYARGAQINLHGTVNRVIDGLIVGDRIDFQGTTTTQVTPPPDGPTTDPILDLGLER